MSCLRLTITRFKVMSQIAHYPFQGRLDPYIDAAKHSTSVSWPPPPPNPQSTMSNNKNELDIRPLVGKIDIQMPCFLSHDHDQTCSDNSYQGHFGQTGRPQPRKARTRKPKPKKAKPVKPSSSTPPQSAAPSVVPSSVRPVNRQPSPMAHSAMSADPSHTEWIAGHEWQVYDFPSLPVQKPQMPNPPPPPPPPTRPKSPRPVPGTYSWVTKHSKVAEVEEEVLDEYGGW